MNCVSEGAEQSQELLEKVTTIYHGDDVGTPVLDRSIELSDRTDSGVYSTCTPTAMQGTQSSGRMSTPQRSSSSSSRKKSYSEMNPTVALMRGKVNRRASANFRAPDEPLPRSSLHVIDAVVKREPVPLQETATGSNADSGACLVTGTGFPCVRVPPLATPAPLQTSPSTLDCAPFFIASSEQEELEDIIEKDTSAELPTVSSPKVSAPIDIPTRNESCITLPRSSTQDSASVNSRDCRSPRAAIVTRQSSTDTTSSDTSSSDGSYIPLDATPAPKDLSHIPPLVNRWSWKKTISGLVMRLNSSGTRSTGTRNGSSGPSYVMGCGMRM